MGANASKNDAHGRYEWKAAGPPGVSLDVLESMQASPETDASRARLIEQHVQARVAEELRRLLRRESEALSLAHEKLAQGAAAAAAAAAAGGPDAADDGRLSRQAVGREVEELRRRLDERKKVHALPDAVESARSDVIRCLREHDRRPLDCWEEVDRFKAEVKKLEKGWVDKVTS